FKLTAEYLVYTKDQSHFTFVVLCGVRPPRSVAPRLERTSFRMRVRAHQMPSFAFSGLLAWQHNDEARRFDQSVSLPSSARIVRPCAFIAAKPPSAGKLWRWPSLKTDMIPGRSVLTSGA